MSTNKRQYLTRKPGRRELIEKICKTIGIKGKEGQIEFSTAQLKDLYLWIDTVNTTLERIINNGSSAS